MSPDDSRHGTNAAYVGGCRCDPCRAATRRYHKGLVLDHHRGIRRLVSALGVRRRIEALGALGWTGAQIGAAMGVSGEHIRQLRAQRLVTRELAARMDAVYEQLSMSLPPETTRAERHNASRQRNRARRLGWLPPLAWNNIDDVNERPELVPDTWDESSVDHAVVERILAGDRIPATGAEKREAMRRWVAAGRSARSLALAQGWHDGRYAPRKDGAA